MTDSLFFRRQGPHQQPHPLPLSDRRLCLTLRHAERVSIKPTMSGAEAVAILGVISSIFSIIDGTKQVYDAATSAEGLPGAFRDVASRLPIIINILSTAEQRIKNGDITEESYKGVTQVIQSCQEKARKLEKLFHKVIPGENASRRKRYLSAVKTLGKGDKLEKLMKGMLEDVQFLVSEHNKRIATKDEVQQLAKAVQDVSAIPPSTPPTPSSTVPFSRDPDYVDRQALLERVNAKCSISGSRTVLVGLGGVG